MTRTNECTRCVMTGTVDPDLVVVDGICNHCRRYDSLAASRIVPLEERPARLQSLVTAIRAAGRGKAYDCLIGVSGGVDSTYVALTVRKLGLRPLAVHVDNGWNSSLANDNVERTLRSLNIDLITETLDPEEFSDLQRAFLRASTPDADIPTDHAIQATLWKAARRKGIGFVISGMNFATESISVPSWSYGHSDWRYIADVQRRHGTMPLTTYPHFGFAELGWTTLVRRTRIVSILNYLDFDKAAAVKELHSTLDWKPYDGKHFESIYTRWVQGYYLPEKFGIDKRRGHYSDLINSGQISRDQALALLGQNDYPDQLRRADAKIVRERLGLSEGEYATLLSAPARSFRDYRNSYEFVQFLRGSVNRLRRIGLYPR